LINHLRNVGKRFEEFVDNFGQGLKIAAQTKDGSHLAKYPFLKITSFSQYGELYFDKFPATKKFEHLGFERGYFGKRLLIKRGITEKTSPKGLIISRYEETPFCFTNAIHSFILKENEMIKYKIFLGIFSSSLARYFFFNTTPMWGTRNAEIHLHEILEFPIIFPQSQHQIKEIVRLVDNLRNYNPPIKSLITDGIQLETINRQRIQWEAELDEAIFDLYQLNNQERDLIRDCCRITIPYFYDPIQSIGAQAFENVEDSEFQNYLETFCRRWEPYLDEGTEMHWHGHIGANGNMVAAHFFIVDKQLPPSDHPICHSWDDLLTSLNQSMKYSLETSSLIIEGMVHLLTDDGVVIIKRNEKRFWTKSKAREDAESTLCKSMMDSGQSSKGGGQ